MDPKILLKEIDMLIENGIDISGLKISSTSHVTMPYHRLLDEAMEADRAVCLLYTSPSPRDLSTSRMPSSA